MNKANPIFFKTQAALRRWFEKHYLDKEELILGYYKKKTGKASVDWSESVDEALCFGWIDGIRRRIDDERYQIRFTPRRAKSHWSAVNIAKIKQLKKAGLMYPEGLAAFERMDPKNSEQFTYEKKGPIVLDVSYEKTIKSNKKAWAFFSQLAPGYKRRTIDWVMQAKREETRLKRLQVLIESAEAGLLVPFLRRR